MSLTAIPVAKGRVPGLGHLPRLLRDPLGALRSLHTEGPVLRLQVATMPVVLVTSPEAVHEVLVNGKAFNKGRMFDRVRSFSGNGLASSDGAYHRRQRRLIQPMFYKERLAGYAETIGKQARALADSWSDGQVIDAHDVMGSYAIGVLTKTLFGADIGAPAIRAVQEDVPLLNSYLLRRAIAPESFDRFPIWKAFDQASARMRAVFDDAIAATRASEPEARGDLLSLLLSARDETGASLTDQEVRDELTTMLFAGSETVVSTLAWTLYYLGRHPEVEQELLAEIDEVIGDRQITFADVPRLPSVGRVLDEVIRLHGVVATMRRTTEEVTIGGYTIPADTEVLLSFYALHRRPDLYPDPNRFDPGRWLPEETAARPRQHVVPLGAGAHKCIGDKFAWMEATITLATILPRWQLRSVPGSKPPKEAVAAVAHPVRVPMVIRQRQDRGRSQ
ncbi:cytochrome P450 [Streptomyces sp. SCSIO 30461]|uniref:cytochrome P450 n=1 Tax=Streptomyces sp. SCSIO 30461 TaxID=3118085 RepID=UPI0030D5A099